MKCCSSVESTKIENASFPYKTAISEANVKPILNVFVYSSVARGSIL